VVTGQPRPHPKGRGPSDPQFGGSFLFMHTSFVAELPNFTWYHWGGGLFLGGQPRTHPNGTGFQSSPIIGVPFCLCLHPLTQNYKISHGNTY